MDSKHYNNELAYQVSIHVANKMLREGVIDENDYKKIRKFLLEKYSPIIGSLSQELS